MVAVGAAAFLGEVPADHGPSHVPSRAEEAAGNAVCHTARQLFAGHLAIIA